MKNKETDSQIEKRIRETNKDIPNGLYKIADGCLVGKDLYIDIEIQMAKDIRDGKF